MRKKKDLPLAILKSLETFVNLRGDKFEVIDPKEGLLKVIDKDEDSDFHFTIEKYQKADNGAFQVYMSRSPKNHNDNGIFKTWLEVSSLQNQFNLWLGLLDEYENVNSFFDDPILKSFNEELYSEFEIIDENSEISPFNIKQILLLDENLEEIENRLSNFITEQNSLQIESIQDDINILRENLTSKSKKWVIRKFTMIMSKIAKQGPKFIKEFLSESKKEIIKEAVKGLIGIIKENSVDFLN